MPDHVSMCCYAVVSCLTSAPAVLFPSQLHGGEGGMRDISRHSQWALGQVVGWLIQEETLGYVLFVIKYNMKQCRPVQPLEQY
jgi:hypothetical protein